MARSNLLKKLTLFLAIASFGAPALAEPALKPAPHLDPAQTAQAMLEALKKNSPEGIAELYSFSSPKNREITGPLARFELMIQESFPDLLGHRQATVAPALIDQNRAMIPVEIQSSEGEISHYIILLSKQAVPECEGCWMADAVFSPEALQGLPSDVAPESGQREDPA